MWPSREPLLTPALVFAAGVAVSAWLSFDLRPLLTGAAASLVLWFAARKWAPRVSCLPLLAVALLGGIAVSVWHRPAPAPKLDAYDGEILLVGGCVVEPGVPDSASTRFVVELEPGARVRVSLSARPGENPPRVDYGRKVEVQARVRKPRNFQNPGAFDYVRYLRRQSIFWTASARGIDALRFQPGQCGSQWRSAVFGIRTWLTERLRAAYASDPYASKLTPALLVGDNSAVERSWTEDFRHTGTYHALVVSGLHITVVAGGMLFLLRLCGAPLWLVLSSSVVLAWTYAAVASFQAPVVRSATGFTLFLLARWLFRQGRLLNLLAVTGVVFLVIDPEQLFEASFQLTFLSVAAIGAIASPLIDRSFGPFRRGLHVLVEPARDLSMAPRVAQFRIELRLLAETLRLAARIPTRLTITALSTALQVWFWGLEMVVISAAVWVFLALAMVVYFHQLSLTSIAANLLIVPALTFAVPIGLVSAVTGITIGAFVTSALVRFGSASAAWWARLEPGWRVPDPPIWPLAALAAAALLLAVLAFRGARMRWILSAGIFAALACGVLLAYPFSPLLVGRNLELTAIDVGQGESLLVTFPAGRLMLVDGGGIPVFDPRLKPKLEIGEDVVSPYLWRRHIRRLDIVAATHLHDDHVAGLAAVIRNFKPSEFWVGAIAECPMWESLRSACRDSGTRIVPLRSPATRKLDGVDIRVIAPAPEYVPRTAPGNDDSLVLGLTYGRHRFLLTGDMGPAIERQALASGLLGEVDVLKVAHHGSRSSTTDEFLETVRPLYAVISAGAGNTYGHPHPDLLARLYGLGVRVYRTDADGLTTFRSDGRLLSVSNGSEPGNFLPLFGEKASY